MVFVGMCVRKCLNGTVEEAFLTDYVYKIADAMMGQTNETCD